MKFSFFHLMPFPDIAERSQQWPMSNRHFDPQVGTQLYERYLDQMVFAESCGFDWIGCNEHHFSPYGLMSNPNLVGAALIPRARRSRIAILGNLVPLLNPIRIAEEYAMLDVMSGGRLVAGLIRGVAHEYLAYNVPPDESWGRFQEALEIIVKAWTEPEPFAWEGEYYQYRAVAIWPRPVQQPHPPILMSGGSLESARFAAKHRAIMGVVQLVSLENARSLIDAYREQACADGWEPGPEHFLVGVHTCIAPTDHEAIALMGPAESHFYNVLAGGPEEANDLIMQKTRYYSVQRDAAARKKQRELRKSISIEDRVAAGTILCGSPDTVVKQITRLRDELGVGIVNMNFKVGQMPNEAVCTGLELFRDVVHPRVTDL